MENGGSNGGPPMRGGFRGRGGIFMLAFQLEYCFCQTIFLFFL